MDIYKIAFLNALTDYCKEKQLGNNLLKRIEGFKNEIYDGNPILNLINKTLSSINIIIPFISFFSAIAAAIQYAVYNRPVIGHIFNDETLGKLIRIPNWNLVYQELHKFPALRLEAMIQKTDCPNDIKITLYKSITSGDVSLFANTINSYYRETSELIELAYVMDFINQAMELGNQRLNPDRELFSPLDEIADLQDFFASQNPFEEFDFGIFTLEESNTEEQALFVLDHWVGMLEELKRIAYPKERKIYNKILGLVSQYPELEKAYDKYKTIQDTISNDESKIDDIKNIITKKKPKVAFEDLVIFMSEIDYANYKPHELLPSLNLGITKQGDSVFKEFIQFLVFSSCIDNNDNIKQLLTYRLTGACRPEGDLEKIPWNPDKLNELAYVIMYSTVRAKGKYEKVREFFEGPKFPDDISMIRTYADSAPQDFRLGLNKLYPDVFTIKGAR